jgi:putative toxin-antitoxin system antitoxin component (TIGR02293 family)
MADALNMRVRTGKFSTSRAAARSAHGRSLGLSGDSTLRIVQQLQKGLPYSSLISFHKASGLSVGSIADLVQIPERTLMRRKARGRLRPDESERLLRISGVFDRALELFEGDARGAIRWLTRPSSELEDQQPLEFARTEIGAREVEDLIGRLEHGVFT